MPSFFGGKDRAGARAVANERISRHSSGWGQLLERLRTEESLRVLDIGPTSSTNINFVTGLGHSIYLANLAEDAARREWFILDEDGSSRFDVERFLGAHLNFAGAGARADTRCHGAGRTDARDVSLTSQCIGIGRNEYRLLPVPPDRHESSRHAAGGGVSTAQYLFEPPNREFT